MQAQNPSRQLNASSSSVNSTQPSPTAQPPQPTIPAPQVAQLGAEGMARRAVLRFYELIDSRNYSAAYAMFSQEWRSKISFESWRKGFSSTLGNQVNRASVVGGVGPGDKECTVRFQLTSRDRVDNGKVYRLFILSIKWGTGHADMTGWKRWGKIRASHGSR